MSATGLDVFDKTVQTTNIWLDEIMEVMGPSRQTAWHILGATLRALRDRLTVDQAAHLGAQLPLLVRGLYYDQWHPASMPSRERTLDQFLARVGDDVRDTRPFNVRQGGRDRVPGAGPAHRQGPGRQGRRRIAGRGPRAVAERCAAGRGQSAPSRGAGSRTRRIRY